MKYLVATLVLVAFWGFVVLLLLKPIIVLILFCVIFVVGFSAHIFGTIVEDWRFYE